MPKGKKRTHNDDEENSDAAMKQEVEPSSSSSTAPITAEGEMPQKKFYRSRAHCNPLSFNEAFDYPTRPDLFDWTEEHYPDHPALAQGSEKESSSGFNSQSASIRPDVLDVGCGFGGLTMALSPVLPNNTILGLEIRSKVTEYVRLRIVASRKEHPGQYQNCSVMRTNAMKYLPNFFPKASLEKLFFCFPDPHFKRKNHPRRIVSERLLTEYAFLLKPEVGRLYCITDVKDLHNWHVEKCDAHPLFERLTDEEMEQDPCVTLMKSETEEGKKVKREGRFGHAMYYQVYKRVDESCPGHVKSVGLGSINAINFFKKGEFGVEVQ
jgi:tRNA (guanine-N7-)-methyltransferase